MDRKMLTVAGPVGAWKAVGVALGLLVTACCVVQSRFLAVAWAARFRGAPLENGLSGLPLS